MAFRAPVTPGWPPWTPLRLSSRKQLPGLLRAALRSSSFSQEHLRCLIRPNRRRKANPLVLNTEKHRLKLVQHSYGMRVDTRGASQKIKYRSWRLVLKSRKVIVLLMLVVLAVTMAGAFMTRGVMAYLPFLQARKGSWTGAYVPLGIVDQRS